MKKCVPTIVKSGGKRGKDIIIVGDNRNCKKPHIVHYIPKFIPVPVYHQKQPHYYHQHQPTVEHQYSYHDLTGAEGYGYGGADDGHASYGGLSGADHMSYDQGYGHLMPGSGSTDYGAY